MQQALRLVIAAFAAIALTQFSALAPAHSESKQVKLSEKQVEGFIGAQKDMESVDLARDPESRPDLDWFRAELSRLCPDVTNPAP